MANNIQPAQAPPAASNPLTDILTGASQAARQIAVQQTSPYGMKVAAAGSAVTPTSLTTANLGSMLPILLIGGGLVLVMMMVRKR